MGWAIGFASMMVSLFMVLAIHPFEGEVINAICFLTLSLLYSGSLLLAEHFENKLEERIEVLEKKLKDREKGGAEE